jgi:predicted RNA-binding Zn ribbon-like protein
VITSSEKPSRKNSPEFLFIGDHPAIDFANTLVLDRGKPRELLCSWSDVAGWLYVAGLANEAHLQVAPAQSAAALKSVIRLRTEWKAALEALAAGGKVGAGFLAHLNELLADDVFHESLRTGGRGSFHLHRSASSLTGTRLVLALLARQIAKFLSESNLEYLRRCANTSSCVLYFYDTTKNHRRQWCSVATCGNRHKAAEFRKRQNKGKS